MKKLLTATLLLLGALTLSACGDDVDPNEALTQEALDSIILSGVDEVKGDLTLPTESRNETTVVWTSSHPAIVAADGTVVRPDMGSGNATVTLTATITLGDVTLTKEFTVRVMEEEPYVSYTSATALYAATTTATPTVVGFTGTVSGLFDGGYFLFDGTNSIGVYNPASSNNLELGDEVFVKGTYASYYTLFQISSVTTENVLSSDKAYTLTPTVVTVAELLALDATDKTIHGHHYTLTGVLTIYTSGDEGQYENLYLEDGDDKVLVYYNSLEDSLTALEAKIDTRVSFDAIYYTKHATNGVMIAFQGGAADITDAPITAALLVASSKAALDLGNISTITSDLTLPATDSFGSTITWASSNTAVIANDGTVTTPTGDEVEVTLTATITNVLGDVTANDTKDFVVTVYDPTEVVRMSVAEALALADGETAIVEAVVTGIDGTDGIFIQNASPLKAIYVEGDFTGVVVGDSVVVIGDLDTSDQYGNDKRLIENGTLIENNNGDHALNIVTTKTAAEIANNFPINSNYTFTAELEYMYTNYGDAFFKGNADDNFFMDGFGDFDYRFQAGDKVMATFSILDMDYGNIRIAGVTLPEATDQELADVFASMIFVPEYIIGDLVLPVDNSVNDVTVSWASSVPATVATDGTVVIPTVNVPVVLTATVTSGDVDVVLTFNSTVMPPATVQPLFFSEYAEADGGSCKYVEIYNPTSSFVILDGYFINRPDEGGTFADMYEVDSLTGVLQAGEVFVIGLACDTDSLSSPTWAYGDYDQKSTAAAAYFNGDDTLGLFFGTTLIDIIGPETTNPKGTQISVGAGSDTIQNVTMVRMPSVTAGETDWDVAKLQWTILPDSRDYSNVGTHTTD